jgi:ketosteroid isomerase-like protein
VAAADRVDCLVTETVDTLAVRAANRAYYEAFEARDLDAMSDIWLHGDDVTCTHPGWKTLHGWGAVAGSWFALFGGPQQLQFILTDERVHLSGDVAWVTVDENLISGRVGATVAAVNVFRRVDERWLMVLHHGSPVAPTTQD